MSIINFFRCNYKCGDITRNCKLPISTTTTIPATTTSDGGSTNSDSGSAISDGASATSGSGTATFDEEI